MYNKDFCVDVSYWSTKWQLKFIFSIVQSLMLNQLVIDKDIHSFILRATVIILLSCTWMGLRFVEVLVQDAHG